MNVVIGESPPAAVERVVSLLLHAEPFEESLRWSLAHLSDAVYAMDDERGELVGAATMRWASGPSCEIVELAIAPEHHGRGLGRRFIAWLLDEARRRGKASALVGTSNASIGNIAFYQKCGFRMHAVRADYFWYYPEAVVENGIRARDMLVFRYDLRDPAAPARSRTGARRPPR